MIAGHSPNPHRGEPSDEDERLTASQLIQRCQHDSAVCVADRDNVAPYTCQRAGRVLGVGLDPSQRDSDSKHWVAPVERQFRHVVPARVSLVGDRRTAKVPCLYACRAARDPLSEHWRLLSRKGAIAVGASDRHDPQALQSGRRCRQVRRRSHPTDGHAAGTAKTLPGQAFAGHPTIGAIVRTEEKPDD